MFPNNLGSPKKKNININKLESVLDEAYELSKYYKIHFKFPHLKLNLINIFRLWWYVVDVLLVCSTNI